MNINAKGNALITVLLVTVVLMTIGLSIVTASIQATKRTKVRETDINITYEGRKILDQITSDLSFDLANNHSLDFVTLSAAPSNFSSQLSLALKDIIDKYSTNKDTCLKAIDLSGNNPIELYNNRTAACADERNITLQTYHLPTDTILSRVIEFIAVIKTPDKSQGFITRTIRKKVILSPLPSFLKYTAGTNGNLVLNGSPNIVGNIYAHNLEIHKEANYQIGDGSILHAATPLPSIYGDIYSDSASLLSILKPENFYKGKVPALKNDSQFSNIDFPDAFQTETGSILSKSELNLTGASISQENIDTVLERKYDFLGIKETPALFKQSEPEADTNSNQAEDLNQSIPDSEFKLIDKDSADPLKVPGDLVISNIDHPVSLNDLVVNGNLYIVSNQDISLKNIAVKGDLHLINAGGSIRVNGQVYAGGSIDIEADQSIHFYQNPDPEAKPYSITAGGNITIKNLGSLAIDGAIFSGGTVTVNSLSDTTISGNIFSYGDLTMNSIDSAFSLLGDAVTNGNLSLKGDSRDPSGENDTMIFNSVIYAKGASTISNLNILGAHENSDELILLSGKKLMITRMNEFSHFQDPDEKPNDSGIPADDSNIQPLKAFFYTEENAELYGVGSLFYINGGIFAKGRIGEGNLLDLEINAMRGNVEDIQSVAFKNADEQLNKYSRFIVVYNKDVLLKRMDALPKVTHLTLFPDTMTVQ